MNCRFRRRALMRTAGSVAVFGFATTGNCQTLIADLRTGVADDGTLIAAGGFDDDYVVVSGNPFYGGPFPKAAIVVGNPDATWDPDAQLLSHRLDMRAGPTNIHYVYEVHFDMPADAVTPRIGGHVQPLDGYSVTLNGARVPSDPTWFEAVGWSYFVVGDNVLTLEVSHQYAYSGLLVDAWVTDVATHHVPADFPTIQSAIDAAFDGDVVLVAPGIYAENIDFKGKTITVRSTDGPAQTTIDGGGVDSVVKFLNGEGWAARLEGFTITNGYGYVGYCNCTSVGGGIVISEQLGTNIPSNPTISRCIITGNNAEFGGGLYSSYCWPLIADCVIGNNSASVDGGGLKFENIVYGKPQPFLVNCTVVNNASISGSVGGVSDAGIGAVVLNCVLWNDSPAELGPTSPAVVLFSDVQGGWAGVGNMNADPLFVDPAAANYHLTSTSPCLDVGDSTIPWLSDFDLDGDARVIGLAVDMGADERRFDPTVTSVTPARARYDLQPRVTVFGTEFSNAGAVTVRFGQLDASNVVVLDDSTLTCDAPVSSPGPTDVAVSNSTGEGVLAAGFLFTPAITIEGTPTPGGSITIHYLFDGGDSALGIWGLPPAGSYSTPPYDGELCIVPFNVYFFLPNWPFAGFDVNATIPNDPMLVGIDVLLQALVGPALTKKPKDGAWTNCATLAIR